VLAAIVVLGVGLRAYRLDWGLPDYQFPDEVLYFVRGGARLVALGQWVPVHFNHPPLLNYVMALVFAAWSLATGEAIAAARAPFYAQVARLTLLGRTTSVLLAGLSIVALYALTKRLLGPRAALLAAAIFAVSPLHVLEAHRITPDVPMVLTMLLATDVAVVAYQRRQRGLLLGAYALAGLAGAFKYTGPSVAAVPAWLTLVWPDAAPWRARLGRLATGTTVMLGALGAGCFAIFFSWEQFWFTFSRLIEWTYGISMPGVDLAGVGWFYARYLYQLVVAFPYMMGWAAYLAALAGFGVLVCRERFAAGVVLAFVVPYFALMGGANAVVARYYLPLAPYLSIAAAAALDWWFRGSASRRRSGFLVAGTVLGYTLLVSVTQCLRLGTGPQQEVVRFLRERARREAQGGERFVIAYPGLFELEYDAVRPIRKIPGAAVVYFPGEYQNTRRESEGPAHLEEQVARDRRWLEQNEVDALVLTTYSESGVRRERPDGPTARFYERLADGSLGFRLAADFHTRFATQSLYTWSDPMLDTHWETAIAGYKVFVRDARPARTAE
jgi:hypothetical protein